MLLGERERRWRTCGRTCGWSRGPATARPSRCARGRRPRRGGRWRWRARRARRQPARARPRGAAGDVVARRGGRPSSCSAVSTRARRGSPSSIEVTVPSSTSTSCPSATHLGLDGDQLGLRQPVERVARRGQHVARAGSAGSPRRAPSGWPRPRRRRRRGRAGRHRDVGGARLDRP